MGSVKSLLYAKFCLYAHFSGQRAPGQLKILKAVNQEKLRNHWFNTRYKTDEIYLRCPYE